MKKIISFLVISFILVNTLSLKAQFINKDVKTTILSGTYVNIKGNLTTTGTPVNTELKNEGTIILGGDLKNDASATSINSGSNSYFKLEGDIQDIGGLFSTTFNNLNIDGTDDKNLSIKAYVKGTLNFIANRILIANNDLVLTSTAAAVTGHNENRFVVTNGTGFLVKESMPNGGFDFPVGNAVGSYKLAKLNNSGASDDYKVRVESGINPTNGININDCVQYTWTVEEGNAGGSAANLRLAWNSTTDEGSSFVRDTAFLWQSVNNVWVKADPAMGDSALTGIANYYTNKTNAFPIISFSNSVNKFIVRSFNMLSICDQPHDTTICSYNTAMFHVCNTGQDITYQWQEKCGSGTWTNLTDTPPYSGVNTSTLYISNTSGLDECQYQCILTQGSTTTTTTPATLTVHQAPVVNVTPNDSITIHIGQSVQLNATPTGSDYTYQWSPGTYLNDTTISNPVSTPVVTITYYVTVTDDSTHCSAIDSVKININDAGNLYIPEAFSPNNDGQNDFFIIQGNGIKEIDFVIYDRWGEKIFETTDVTKGWDGTYKGKKLAPAVFVYYVKGLYYTGDLIDLKGNFTLVR